MESLSLYVNESEIGILLQSQLTHLPSRFILLIRASGQFRAGIFILSLKKPQLFVIKKLVGDMTSFLLKDCDSKNNVLDPWTEKMHDFYRIVESLRVEKTSKFMESDFLLKAGEEMWKEITHLQVVIFFNF